MGIRGRDGVVFGVEKLVLSKLYEYGANKRIIHIDNHIGMVSFLFFISVLFAYCQRPIFADKLSFLHDFIIFS